MTGVDAIGAANPFRHDLLRGRVAIVTGGGTGIGRGIAAGLATCGARVVVVGRRLDLLEEVAREIATSGRLADALACDVRDPSGVAALMVAAEELAGSVNLLVNCAGATYRSKAEDLSPKGFRAVVETDAFGTFYMCQELGRRLIARGDAGAILNITSTSTHTGNPGRAHGGVGKAGVDSLTKSLAVEWGRHDIRINSLAPGYTPTLGVDHAVGITSEAMVARRGAAVPLGRVGSVMDVIWPAVFLLSPAAAYITGASLVVDGGALLSTGRGLDYVVGANDAAPTC